jgi:cytochrome c oxidase cbb3-type subunit 3
MTRRSLASVPRATLVLAAALAASGCNPPPADAPAAFSGRPDAKSLVGPIPGPGGHAAMRNPLAGDASAPREGRRLFVQFNCSGCHGGRAGGGMGPSLRDTLWLYGGSDAQVFDSIAQGRAHGMPAWGTKLPEEVVWKLVAYIGSLRTPEEPDAPEARDTSAAQARIPEPDEPVAPQ